MNTDALNLSSIQVRKKLPADFKPHCAVILGSGWGPAGDNFDTGTIVSYEDIPVMGKTSVDGHRGRLVTASADDMDIVIFQGRRHWYEGAGWEPVVFPVFFASFLGVSRILLTNAAGGIAEGMAAGSLMIIEDHINFMGVNPLCGEHYEILGPRFPDQSAVYSRNLNNMLEKTAHETGMKITRGVYAAMAGPVYETPAEVRMLRNAGASAVGMSTVPEAILANSMGMDVAGVSFITNMAAGLSEKRLSHGEIASVAESMTSMIEVFLAVFFSKLAKVSND